MFGVRPAEHRAGVLQHGVLKAAARAQERAVLLAGEPDRAQRPVRAAVRAGGHAPERVVRGDPRIRRDLLRGHPLVRDLAARSLRGEREGPRNGLVRGHGGVMVADQADADHLAHAFLGIGIGGVAHG
jgi:hypothetical protein